MLSANSDLTVDQIKTILRDTAVKINKDNPRNYQDHWGNQYSDRYNDGGHSLVYGMGRVDAGAAVAKAFDLKTTRTE